MSADCGAPASTSCGSHGGGASTGGSVGLLDESGEEPLATTAAYVPLLLILHQSIRESVVRGRERVVQGGCRDLLCRLPSMSTFVMQV